MKKGQATPFIIVGIIVVILVVIVIFLTKPATIGGGLSISQVQPVKNYIDECIKTKVDEELVNLRRYGGHPSAGLRYIKTDNGKVRVLLTRNPIKSDRNSGLDDNIEDYLKLYLDNDECNVKDFFDDFVIDTGNSEVEVSMSDQVDNIIVDVKWPITIRKGIRSIKLDEFSYVKKDDIEFVNNIVVSEILQFEKAGNGVKIGNWKNENKFSGRVFDDITREGLDISDKMYNFKLYTIYKIDTKLSRTNGLNEFEFAVEK